VSMGLGSKVIGGVPFTVTEVNNDTGINRKLVQLPFRFAVQFGSTLLVQVEQHTLNHQCFNQVEH
jgi:hypothetical protein